jgi:hypothetical protein
MKKLYPKTNRLLIKFNRSKRLSERIESFRTTSIEKAQKIISKRNTGSIQFAAFAIDNKIIRTDRKLELKKVELI